MIFSGVVSRYGLGAIEVELLDFGEIWAGEPAHAVVRARNRSRWIEVRDLVIRSRDLDGTAIVDRIPPGAAEDVVVRFVFEKRGEIELKRLELYTIFPFGFFSKKRRAAIDARGVVFPSRAEGGNVIDTSLDTGDLETASRAGDGQDLFALRDYREGESVRHIHWKKSASSGRWIVWQSAADVSDRLHVIFDAISPAASEEEFEELVRMATGTIAHAIDQGRRVILHIGGASLGSEGGADEIFTALALVQRSWQGDAPEGPSGSIVFSLRHGTN